MADLMSQSWQWLTAHPAAAARYIRRRMVPYEYVRLVEWLRVRAPFNHTRCDRG